MKCKFLFVFFALFFNALFLVADDVAENIPQDSTVQPEEKIPESKIKIYIENSYSMAGYYKEKDMNLSDSINNLITKLSSTYQGDMIELYSIANDKTESLTADYRLNKDMDELFHTNENFQVKRDACSSQPNDPRCDSKLNKIVGKILNDTHGATISFLVSDLIYSIPKESSNTDKILSKLQGDTEQVFLSKRHENQNFAAVLVRLMVKFSGTYYNYKNSKNSGKTNYKNRPIYLLAVGDKARLLKFFKDKEVVREKLNNFNDIAYFMTYDSEGDAFADDFTVLPVFNEEKKINPGRIETGDPIHAVYDWENVSEFFVAANVNCLNIDTEKSENYSGKKVIVKSAEKFDPEKLNTQNKYLVENTGKKYTHLLQMEKDGSSNSGYVEISIKDWDLNNNAGNIPWVSKYSTSDDVTNFKPETTFGLSYFVKGVDAAFRGENSEYDSCFSLKLSIGHSDEKKDRTLAEWFLTVFFHDNPDEAWGIKDFPTLFGRISSAFIWFCIILFVLPLIFNFLYFKVVVPSDDKMKYLCLTMFVSSLFSYLINIVLALCLSDLDILSSSFALLLGYLFTIPMICSVIWFFTISFALDFTTKLGVWKTITNKFDNLPEEDEEDE